MILVSIILTCYKQEKFIEETILSVINQRYKNRELLIGDDSPDDSCRSIITKYKKKYPDKIKAWHHNPNKGIVNNMGFLIVQRNKKSEYVAFLEGDDCLFPEYLEKKLEIFYKHPNVKLVYNELNTINKDSEIIEKQVLGGKTKKFLKKGKINYNELISHIYYMSWSTLMVRTDILNKYGIHIENFGNQSVLSDIYFFNKIANNEDIYGIKEPLVYYRIHEDSVTKNIHGTVKFNLEYIKYVEYLFNLGLINNNTYKNETCNRYIIIILFLLKKSFSFDFFRTISLFFLAFTKSFKYRIGKIF